MKNIIKIIFIGIFMTSCSGNEDAPENNVDNEPLLRKITNVLNIIGSDPPSQLELVTTFEYDNNLRLTKKTGGYLTNSPSSGFNYPIFTNKNLYFTYLYRSKCNCRRLFLLS